MMIIMPAGSHLRLSFRWNGKFRKQIIPFINATEYHHIPPDTLPFPPNQITEPPSGFTSRLIHSKPLHALPPSSLALNPNGISTTTPSPRYVSVLSASPGTTSASTHPTLLSRSHSLRRCCKSLSSLSRAHYDGLRTLRPRAMEEA